jgi:leucyl aminopeptidase (aminopeptidase T)
MSSEAASYGAEPDTAVRSGRLVEVMRTAHRIVHVNSWIQPGETVLILCDHEVSPMIVDALAGQVYAVDATPLVLRMQPQDVHGEEPPAPVAAAVAAADVVYAVVSKSVTHTRAVQDALANGTRYLGFSNITEDAFIRGAATADPRVLRDIGERVRARLEGSPRVRVTSPLGTDVSFSLAGRAVMVGDSIIPEPSAASGRRRFSDAGRMFPDGEAYCCPLEDSVNGRIVVDRWMQGIGLLGEPITWDFVDGVCVEISGGAAAAALRRVIDEQGDEYSRRIGEFAIGINPAARLDGNPHREGKKLLGSCHFALGTGTVCGGRFQSSLHLDGLLTPPRIEVDGQVLFDRGKLMKLSDEILRDLYAAVPRLEPSVRAALPPAASG